MSKLYELIATLCPQGVEYKKIGDVIQSLTTGLNPRKNFVLNTDTSTCPYITGKDIYDGKVNVSERTDKITESEVKLINKRAKLQDDVILFASTGTGTVGRMAYIKEYSGDWNVSETLYIIKTNNDIVLAKYLMYVINSTAAKNQYEPKISKGSVPHLKIADLTRVSIPVPPLEVQREIVRVLDSFTLLTAELTAELTARKKQYDFYRNALLEKSTDVRKVRLGDIATITRGGNFQKKDFCELGKPCIHYGQMYTHFGIAAEETLTFLSEEIFDKSKIAKHGDIVMAVTSENVEDVCSCTAWLGQEDIAVSGHTAIISHNQNPKYLSYYFHSEKFAVQKKKLAHGTKVIEVTPSKLENIEIMLPSIAEQERIVSILDRFDSLCNDISSGLPAEINARQKQYEYYRDKLLSFEEAI